MSERWFSEEELAELARPTMERAIEAIDCDDAEEAKHLCEAMKWESQFMHDLLVDGVAGLISFVKERLGDDGVEQAWEYSLERSWRGPVERIARTDRKAIAEALAATWRAHSTSGVGPNPGAFEIAEDHEKLTFTITRVAPASGCGATGATGPTVGASPTRRTAGATGARVSRSTAPTARS
jgi:hypothetical protein